MAGSGGADRASGRGRTADEAGTRAAGDVVIRPLDIERDAAGVVGVLREANPQWIVTAEAWRYELEHWPPETQLAGWVAMDGHELVGVSLAHLNAWTTEPHVGHVSTTIRADRRRRGIGAQLYTLAEEHAVGLEARKLFAWLVETPEGLRFAVQRGWLARRFAVYSRVDPATVELSRLERLPPNVAVAPLAEFRDRLEEVYAAVAEAVLDEPSSAPADALTLEHFLDELRNPLTSWDGSFCTLAGDEVATFAGVYADPESRSARNGFTGTRRDHRGRGYASFAKLASMRWLASNGYAELWTGNDETNEPMLAVNRRLGYRPALRAVEVGREL